MSGGQSTTEEKKLRETLETHPADWGTRKQLARLLYDRGEFLQAADMVWEVDKIPSIDMELAFAARVLAKASPRKAIRLLTALLEHNHGKAVQNLGLANALLHHGMVLQAARFYGAALEADPSLANPELEHFILWTDDEETLWGGFKERRPQLGNLPWMTRDPEEAMKLTSKIDLHTTPVKLPDLKPAAGEELKNDLYRQTAEKGAEPGPPPAVTIPLDRVDPKHRLFDSETGAPDAPEFPGMADAEADAGPAPPKPDIAAEVSASPPAIGGPPTVKLLTPPAPERPRPVLPPLGTRKPDI